jgi:hypothetical protein
VVGACIANPFYFVTCQSYIAQTRLGLALEVSEWDEADTGGEVEAGRLGERAQPRERGRVLS